MKAFDVAIIGSGLGGGTLGLILARRGLRVLLLEREHHPRFALGEAGIKETSLSFLALAERFDVPELGALASAERVARHIAPTSGQKESFSFLWHGPGEPHKEGDAVQVGSPPFPFGIDAHYLRADVDRFVAHAAVARGATLVEGAEVAEVDPRDGGVTLRLKDGRAFEARFVADGGGRASPLYRQLALGEGAPGMRAASRSLFTHLRGVRPCDEAVSPASAVGLPHAFHSGTTHHLFPGGWMWVIPFDNRRGSTSDLCSVGLSLDEAHHPRREGVDPAEEVAAILGRFPSIAAQLKGASLARPWASTGRLQHRAAKAVGWRWALLPHAAGFVDPLFSRGLYLSATGTGLLADALLTMLAMDDLDPAHLAAYEAGVLATVDTTDRLVRAAYDAFASFELFNAWHRVWALGAFYESQRLGLTHLTGRALPTADPPRGLPFELPSFGPLFDAAAGAVGEVAEGRRSPSDAAASIFRALATSPLSPPPLRCADGERRYLNATGPRSNLALRRWARSDAGAEVAPLFDYPVSGAARALARRWFG